MLARLRKSQEEREGGFTLIELLVVIIIIGILAAIAIPTFLNQRKKGWDSAMKSALKDAATANESYFTDYSTYVTTAGIQTTGGELNTQGWNPSNKVTLTIVSGSTSGYCMTATHSSYSGRTWYMSNTGASAGAPNSSSCS